MLAEIIMYIIIFMYGIVLGSFLNVLIYRIPKGEGVAMKSSHCMSCGMKIKWYDLIPVISYIILKGRCRGCGGTISLQYPLAEAANGAVYVFIFWYNGICFESVLYALMFSVFLVISVIDFRTYEIPFCLNAAILVLAAVRLIWEQKNIVNHIIGFVSVSGFMLVCLIVGRKLKGIDAFGGGDIKLTAAAGLFLGAEEVILGFLAGCVLGAVIHTVRMKVSGEDHVLAFGPYLCGGMFIAMLFGHEIIDWYAGTLML